MSIAENGSKKRNLGQPEREVRGDGGERMLVGDKVGENSP
jgi:hypothetical protein